MRENADSLRAHRERLVIREPPGDRLHLLLEIIHRRENIPPCLIVNIPPCAADRVHCVIHTVSGQTLQRVHRALSILPDLHKQGIMSHNMAGDADPQQMRMNPLQFLCDHADILPALRYLDARYIFNAQAVCQRMGMRADAAHPLHQRDRLNKIPLLTELFNAAVIVSDKDLCIRNALAVHDQSRVNRLLQRGMIWSDRNDVTHKKPLFLLLDVRSSYRPGRCHKSP